MKYDEETLFYEFRRQYAVKDEDYKNRFIELLNQYYDTVKTMPIDVIRSLLPTREHTGPGGTYFCDWMIKKVQPIPGAFPFTIEASIYDWCGDRTTTDVVHAVGNTVEQVLSRLLLDYMMYLIFSSGYDYLNKIINTIKQYEQRQTDN